MQEGKRNAYIVDRSKIHEILHRIALELSVVVYHYLAVCVVDGNGLGIAIFGLAISSFGAGLGPGGSNTFPP